MNPILSLITNHYSITPRVKTEQELLAEQKIFGLPFNRWLLFPAAVIFQFCCGSLYAWSVYNAPIDMLMYGEDRQMSPITFYIAVGFFGVSAAIMGPWLERNGPRKAGLVGSTLFLIGNLLTALALYTKQMWLVYVGYGIIGGFGLGLCYISPVSALQKWFPDKRGMGSGFAVCGFGAGSIVVALIPLPLSKAVGLPATFLVLGAVFFVLMVISSLVLRTPPPNFSLAPNKVVVEKDTDAKAEVQVQSQIPQLSLIESLSSTEFRVMYIMFFANAIFGLVVISRLSNMIRLIFHQSAADASIIVSINGGFNLFGRLFFSIVSDKLGRKACYTFMLTCQVIILGCFSTLTESKSYWPFVICIWLLTACYGGGFGVVPAFLTDMFGSSNIGACHGVILTAWSIAGVGGGLLFTAIFNAMLSSGYTAADPHPYNVNVWWIFGVVIVGWLIFLTLRVSWRDRLYPSVPGEIIRARIGSRLLRLETKPQFRLHYLTPEEEDEEWRNHQAHLTPA